MVCHTMKSISTFWGFRQAVVPTKPILQRLPKAFYQISAAGREAAGTLLKLHSPPQGWRPYTKTTWLLPPLTLNLSTRWRRMVNAPVTLPRRKQSRYPLHRRLGEPPIRSARLGKEANIFPLPEIEPRIFQPVAKSLHWLSYPASLM